jgi:hypothetical protein
MMIRWVSSTVIWKLTRPNAGELRQACSVRHARACRAAFVIAAALIITLVARAAEPPLACVNCRAEQALPSADIVPDAPAKSSVPLNDPAVQAQPPGCAEWTDRCVSCQRERGKIACSNIGIACQPRPVECLRAEPAEEKKQGN